MIVSFIASNILHVSVVNAPCILDLLLSMSGSVPLHCTIINSSSIILMVCERMTDSCDYVSDSTQNFACPFNSVCVTVAFLTQACSGTLSSERTQYAMKESFKAVFEQHGMRVMPSDTFNVNNCP